MSEPVAVSPFPYQGPLEPEQVHGRDDLLADLVRRVTERRVTALLGPRRFGKTSLLRRLSAELTEVSTVTVDFFGVQTHADLVTRMTEAMAAAVPAVRDRAVELSAGVGIDLGVVNAQLSLSPRRRPDARMLYNELVAVLVKLSARIPLLAVFDEFQAIASVEGAAAVLRTQLQHHYRHLGLVFAGSAPSAMRDIFTRHDQPFFNQADLVDVGPLSRSAVTGIVADGFSATGRDAGTVAGHIYGLTGGHPQRAMRAADEVWRHANAGRPADEVWGKALLALRGAEAATLAATYDDLAPGERKVLRVLANGGSLYGSAAQRLELWPGAADHARRSLLADGKLRSGDDGQVVITDPLLGDWIRERLPL